MNAANPSSLPSAALARRLAELCSEARNVQADFLLHLAEFERRRGAHLEAGYGSLWSYCLEALHLREGAAGRRIGAMKVLRRFPALEAPLRDGRLCLSTVCLLGPLLTDENLYELVALAAFLSKADTEKLVVSIRPRVAPRDGVRRLPGRAAASDASGVAGAGGLAANVAEVGPGAANAVAGSASLALGPADAGADVAARGAALGGAAEGTAAPGTAAAALALVPLELHAANDARMERAPRGEIRPISDDLYSVRVTIDAACKAELDRLIALLSHSTGGDLSAVLGEAIRCGIAKHGKRRGAVEPERKRSPRAVGNGAAGTPGAAREAKPFDPRAIPLAVRREVWKRDGGRCAYVSPDGRRCNSTWKLELDHIDPAARGGPSTADNLRVACKPHNLWCAVVTFGREHMTPFLGEFAISGDSDREEGREESPEPGAARSAR